MWVIFDFVAFLDTVGVFCSVCSFTIRDLGPQCGVGSALCRSEHCRHYIVEGLTAAGAEEFCGEGGDLVGPAQAVEGAEEVFLQIFECAAGGQLDEEVGFEGVGGGGGSVGGGGGGHCGVWVFGVRRTTSAREGHDMGFRDKSSSESRTRNGATLCAKAMVVGEGPALYFNAGLKAD